MQIFSKNLRAHLLRMNGSQFMAFLDQFSPYLQTFQHNLEIWEA